MLNRCVFANERIWQK